MNIYILGTNDASGETFRRYSIHTADGLPLAERQSDTQTRKHSKESQRRKDSQREIDEDIRKEEESESARTGADARE